MLQERLEHALIHRCLSFATAFGLVAFGAGLAPDEVEAVETVNDHYVLGGAAPVPVPAEPVDPGSPLYGEAELNDLVGRIALYPDDLIAIVLPASTFPLQVVEAERFLDRSEQDGSTTPDPDWDQSVVALLNYPDVIRLMNEDLEWMSRLGDAVVNQQPDVLAAISQFREHAYAAGNLRSDDRQVVSRPAEVIEIAPADPEVIYVPYYEPARVVVYQTAPAFYYYPRPCPVYYYSYPPDYWYRPHWPFWPHHFWGVSLVFNIGWHEHHLHVHDHGHWRRPHFGHPHYAWDRHHHRHDRRWHHDDDRHDARHDDDDWHDHEGDRDRGHGSHSRFASSSRKGQGTSTVAKPAVELASAADTGKGHTRPAKPVGSAQPVGQPRSGKPAASTNPTKSAPAKPASPTKSTGAKPVTTAGSSKGSGAKAGGRSESSSELAGPRNGQDKGPSGARPSTQKPARGNTQLASGTTPVKPKPANDDRADGRAKPGVPASRSTAQSQRSAPATQYMNGFASQPQARSTQTWSTAQPQARTSSREYTTQHDDQRERSSAPSRSAEPRYSPPPQASRSQAPHSAPTQASRSAPAPKPAPAQSSKQSSKGDSGGSGEQSSGRSSSRGDGGKSNRN